MEIKILHIPSVDPNYPTNGGIVESQEGCVFHVQAYSSSNWYDSHVCRSTFDS